MAAVSSYVGRGRLFAGCRGWLGASAVALCCSAVAACGVGGGRVGNCPGWAPLVGLAAGSYPPSASTCVVHSKPLRAPCAIDIHSPPKRGEVQPTMDIYWGAAAQSMGMACSLKCHPIPLLPCTGGSVTHHQTWAYSLALASIFKAQVSTSGGRFARGALHAPQIACCVCAPAASAPLSRFSHARDWQRLPTKHPAAQLPAHLIPPPDSPPAVLTRQGPARRSRGRAAAGCAHGPRAGSSAPQL